MADMSGSFQASPPGIDTENEEKETEGHLGELMERLRSKSNQPRSWSDTTKILRMAVVDRRHQSEGGEKTVLQRHLETLQKCIKVNSLTAMLERLESLAHQVNLKFSSGQSGLEVFITSDMFYVELLLEPTGAVKDVKISHNGDPASCPELVKALNDGDFTEFQAHLEGLSSVYLSNGDKKQKNKSFLALQALETDLDHLAQFQSTISSVSNYIHKSPLGILQPRNGGRPMKLIYFVGPYDLLNENTKSAYPMTVEAIIDNQVGYSLTVGIESSAPHKLQNIPLMTIHKSGGTSLPSFSSINNVNSCTLPAVFMLRLQKPVPLSMFIIRKIQNTTGVEFADFAQMKPLMSLIVHQMTGGQVEPLDNTSRLFVTLPDQQHCYFLNGVNGRPELQGILVSQIPFTHPTNVPTIINHLRQQVLFNTVIASCVRKNPKKDLCSSLTFEVTPLSLQHVTVTFEHPLKESIATGPHIVDKCFLKFNKMHKGLFIRKGDFKEWIAIPKEDTEFDLQDITNVKCKICTSEEDSICTNEYACKVMQRSLSLPVTLRAILKKATGDLDLQIIESPPQVIPATNGCLSKFGLERRQAFIEAHADNRFGIPTTFPELTAPLEPMEVPSMVPPFMEPVPVVTHHDIVDTYKLNKVSRNPMLASLLDQENPSPEQPLPQAAPMLSALLGDQPQSQVQAQALPNPRAVPIKQKRKYNKRRSVNDKSPGMSGKSPKRKPSEDDFKFASMDVESEGSNSFDFPATMSAVPSHSMTGAQSGSVGGIVKEESNQGRDMSESHVTKLASSLDHIIKQESKNLQTCHQSEMSAILNDLDRDVHKNQDGEVLGEGAGDVLGVRKPVVSKGSSLAELLDAPDAPLTFQADVPHGGNPGKELPTEQMASSTPSSMPSSQGFSPRGRSRKSFESEPMEFSFEPLNPDPLNFVDKLPAVPDTGGSGDTNLKVVKHPHTHSESRNSDNNVKVEVKQEIRYEEKSNKEKRKEKREVRDNGQEDRPPEREKLWMKVNTKDLTAKTFMKESPSHTSSPQEGYDSKSLKEAKSKDVKKQSPSRIYDMNSDDGNVPLPYSRPTLIAQDTGKPGSPSLKIKKISSGSFSLPKVDKKRSSRHMDGESRKRKESKERGRKKKRIKVYENDGDYGGDARSSSEKHLYDKVTPTIKITTTGGKLQVQSSIKTVPVSPLKSSSSRSLSVSPGKSSLKSHSIERGVSPSKSGRSSGSKSMSRSKSASEAVSSIGGKLDSKLIRTPTIKLKPIVMPSSTATITVTSTSKSSQSGGQNLSKFGDSQGGGSSKQAKAAAIKNRKNSLSAVIDKLTKQHSTGNGSGLSYKGGGDWKDGQDRRESPTSSHRKDPIAEKNKMEAIRKAIIHEGIKPSPPTGKEGMASFKPTPSFRKLDPSKKLDHKHSKLGMSGPPRPGSHSAPMRPGSLHVGGPARPGALPPIPLKSNNSFSGDSNKSSLNSNKEGLVGLKGSAGGSTPTGSDPIKGRSLLNSTSGSVSVGSVVTDVHAHREKFVDGALNKKDHREKESNSIPVPSNAPGSSALSLNSQSAAESSSQRNNSKQRVEDYPDRLASRHFLDVVAKLNDSGTNTKEGERRTTSRTPSEESSGKGEKSVNKLNGNVSRNQTTESKSESGSVTLPGRTDPRLVRTETSGGNSGHVSVSKEASRPTPAVAHECNKEAPGNVNSGVGASVGRSNGSVDVTPPAAASTSTVSVSSSVTSATASASSATTSNKLPEAKRPETNVDVDASGSEDKENTGLLEDDSVFKAPTPKSARAEERAREDRHEGRSRSDNRSKPLLSPHSDVSSPEDSLVIDCPGTPTSRSVRSPVCKSADRSPIPRSPVENSRSRSPGGVIVNKSPRSPSPRKTGSKSSPVPSPTTKSPMMPHNSPVQAPSPLDPLDDDLMDEALML